MKTLTILIMALIILVLLITDIERAEIIDGFKRTTDAIVAKLDRR